MVIQIGERYSSSSTDFIVRLPPFARARRRAAVISMSRARLSKYVSSFVFAVDLNIRSATVRGYWRGHRSWKASLLQSKAG